MPFLIHFRKTRLVFGNFGAKVPALLAQEIALRQPSRWVRNSCSPMFTESLRPRYWSTLASGQTLQGSPVSLFRCWTCITKMVRWFSDDGMIYDIACEKKWYCWCFRNPANQLRFTTVFLHSRWWSPDFFSWKHRLRDVGSLGSLFCCSEKGRLDGV